MGVLTREELDALRDVVSRRFNLWSMHSVNETLSEPPRTLNQGYPDRERLYEELTRGFDEADEAGGSREELLARVKELARRLKAEYVVALAPIRNN